MTAGDISATGAGSDGVKAIALGAEQWAGNVTVDVKGAVSANADGILARSEGKLGNGDVQVTVELQGSVDGAIGVEIAKAATATITNHGAIGSSAKKTALVVDAVSQSVRIDNDGALSGSIHLAKGATANSVNNTGHIYAGSTVDLGGGTLDNSNVVTIGDEHEALKSTLSGNYVQEQGASLVFNLLGKTDFSTLTVDDLVNFKGGNLVFDFDYAYTPEAGDVFTFLASTSQFILGLDRVRDNFVIDGVFGTVEAVVGTDNYQSAYLKILSYAPGGGICLFSADGGGDGGCGGGPAAPESSTWVMMGLGFAGLAFIGWRRPRKRRVAA